MPDHKTALEAWLVRQVNTINVALTVMDRDKVEQQISAGATNYFKKFLGGSDVWRVEADFSRLDEKIIELWAVGADGVRQTLDVLG